MRFSGTTGIVLFVLLVFLWFGLQAISGGLFYDYAWGVLAAHGFQKAIILAKMAQYVGPLILSAFVVMVVFHIGHRQGSAERAVTATPAAAATIAHSGTDRTTKSETPTKPIEPPPPADTYLRDAVLYALHGRWFGPKEKVKAGVEVGSIIGQMNHLAENGRLVVWGKSSPAHAHEHIPVEYWKGHGIDFMSVVDGKRDGAKTKRDSYGASNQKYECLMVNRLQIEKLWPQ